MFLEVIDPERHRHAPTRPERVDEKRKPGARHSFEKKRGSTGLHSPVGYGRYLEVCVHGSGHANELLAFV
jgi:hypothetical protein